MLAFPSKMSFTVAAKKEKEKISALPNAQVSICNWRFEQEQRNKNENSSKQRNETKQQQKTKTKRNL